MASAGEHWGMFATDVADFNGDGWLDLISQSFGGSNGIRIYRNNGDGTWTYVFGLPGGSVSYTLETGDFNADGYLDFAGTRTTGSIYLGDGDFGFTLAQSGISDGIYCVDVGDFDGDGRDDLLIDHGSAGVKAWRLDPVTDTWVSCSNGLPGTNAQQVQLGDLNGDGFLDAVIYIAPTGRCYIGDGAGNWTADASWTMPTPGSGNALRLDGDIDHDGREDIVVLAVKSGFPFYRNQLRVYSPWLAPDEQACRVVMPRGGETLRQGSIRQLRWTTAVPVGQGPVTVDLLLSSTGEDGPWTPLAGDLPDNGRYEWRVTGSLSEDCFLKVVASNGIDTASALSGAPFTIAEGTTTAAPDGDSTFSLRGFPNPLVASTSLRWSQPLATAGKLRILDVQGRLVDEIALPPGSRSARWQPARELPAGVYLAEIRGGTHREITRLAFLK